MINQTAVAEKITSLIARNHRELNTVVMSFPTTKSGLLRRCLRPRGAVCDARAIVPLHNTICSMCCSAFFTMCDLQFMYSMNDDNPIPEKSRPPMEMET